MDLRSLQNKTIDLKCTIEEKLRQLNPVAAGAGSKQQHLSPFSTSSTNNNNNNNGTSSANGGGGGWSAGEEAMAPNRPYASAALGMTSAVVGQVGHVLKVGKHRVLSTAGLLEETVDADYYDRVRAATQSKALLLQIEHEFKAVIGAVTSLSEHYDSLLGLLEKFRATCDDQLARDADAEALRQWADEEGRAAGAASSSTSSPPSNKPSHDGAVVHDVAQAQTDDNYYTNSNTTKKNTNESASSFSDDFVVISPAPPPTAASASPTAPPPHAPPSSSFLSLSSSHHQRYRITPVDNQLAALRKLLSACAANLKEGVLASCHPIALTTRGELDAAQTRIIGRITALKTDYDLLRHRAAGRGVLVLEGGGGGGVVGGGGAPPSSDKASSGRLGTSSHAEAFINQIATSSAQGSDNGNTNNTYTNNYNNNNTNNSFFDNDASFAANNNYNTNNNSSNGSGANGGRKGRLEVYHQQVAGGGAAALGTATIASPTSYNKAIAPVTRTTIISMPDGTPTDADLKIRDELLRAKFTYDEAMAEAKNDLHFVLQQTSMSTWACYNVFFQQMANYYGDVTKGNGDLAKVLVAIKNEQSISKQLTAERRERIAKRAEAVVKEKAWEDLERAAGAGNKNNNSSFSSPSAAAAVATPAATVVDDFFTNTNNVIKSGSIADNGQQQQQQQSKNNISSIVASLSEAIPMEDEFGDFLSGSATGTCGGGGGGKAAINATTNTNTNTSARQPAWGNGSPSAPPAHGGVGVGVGTASSPRGPFDGEQQKQNNKKAASIDWDAMFES